MRGVYQSSKARQRIAKKVSKTPTPADKYPLVFLKWLDAESKPQWESKDETDRWSNEIFTVTDVGWIIDENKTYVTICSQLSSDGDFGSKTKIPKSWVLKRTRIKCQK